MLRRARESVDRRRQELRRAPKSDGEPSRAEVVSRLLVDVRSVPTELVRLDPDFANTRQFKDPDRPSEVGGSWTMDALLQSIAAEGLKVPLVVTDKGDWLALRAGFRRWECVCKLKWKTVPVQVLPRKTHLVDEYWVNILENTTRKALTTYEVACAARKMRDEFDVYAAEFARRTGYSGSYVSKLLSCLDNLPPLLIESWRSGALLPFDDWYKLSLLTPDVAVKTFRKWVGIKQGKTFSEPVSLEVRGKQSRRLAPVWFADRMQRLYLGIEGSDVPPRTRDVLLKVVEYCMGQADSVPGVYEPGKQKEYARRAQLRRELALPDLPGPDEQPAPLVLDDEDENDES